MDTDKVLYDKKSKFERYQVVDMVYMGRPARVLFSGMRSAAQSGIPLDNQPDMLFDYNQRFLELVESLKAQKILVIGGGSFTLPTAIVEKFSKAHVDVVEQDSELKVIAERFFDLKAGKQLQIIIGDGRKYLSKSNGAYDLIIIDAFVHNITPRELSTKEFVRLVAKNLGKNGVVAVNVISAYHGPGDSVLKQQYATYKSAFKRADIFPADKVLSLWISQNFILVATNKRLKPKYSLRFENLSPPLTGGGDVQYDKQN